ncbi:unnamed protein product [Adineta steineri]|uniref:G-protein coupled receptors family 1 profile domain-containing protein n=2 Tax=Adineta steineri TaxID=433720 RepID=A0A814TIB8_9BILA|nr:unnamed protein product [Adineta steineri]
MSSSDSFYIELLNNIIVYIYRYATPVIYIIGNIGNLLNAWVFLKKSWSKNVCVLYFKVCLFLSSAYLNSVILGNTFIIGYNINAHNSNIVLCKLFFYFSFLISMLLTTVLVLASIDRLLISSQNVDTRLYSSKRLAYFSISCSTIFWMIFNIHAFIRVNIQVIPPSFVICYYDPIKLYADFIVYLSMTFNCVFCFLMIILCVLSVKNVRRIRIIPRQQRNQIRSMTKKDFQLLRCLFLFTILHTIASIFPTVYSIYAVATSGNIPPTLLQRAIDDFLKHLFNFCYYIFYSTSFFIFFGVSKAFRQELKRMIYKLFGQHLIPLQEDEQKEKNNADNNVEVNAVSIYTVGQLKVVDV